MNMISVTFFSLCLIPAPAPDPAVQGGLTPHQVARIRSVGEAVVAPDGGLVAYTLNVPRTPLVDEDGRSWSELHVASPGGTVRPFVTGKVNVSHVAWTPDGRAISFLARRGADRSASLYLLPIDGGEARRLLQHETDITGYSWSPDGKKVAFLAAEPVPEERIKLREKGFNQEAYEEDVPFVRVWIAGIDDATEKPRMLQLEGSASELSWAPQGTHIAVALAPTPLVDDDYMRRRVHIVDTEAGAVVAKIANPGKLGQVAWSPDGKNLALISGADINDPSAGRLTVVPATGGTPRDLLPGCDCDVSDLAWQNADTLVFIRQAGVRTSLESIRRDGSAPKSILEGGTAVFSGLSISQAGSPIALVGHAPAHPAELYCMNQGGTAPRLITNSNPWLSEAGLGIQEVVQYKARDGLELEGILIHPRHEEPGRRYPLVLVVHGGPESHYSNGWLTDYSSPGQVAAGRGFAVFYPNYRGSTGRGVDFAKLSRGDPAGKEFDDLVDGVDHLVERGLVDRAKVGITGGSYGGYASAWGATFYSDRFAASVMFVGISDEISKQGSTDIPWEMYYVHLGYWPWNQMWMKTLERSPIYYAGQSQTPTLILGGADDRRVPPGQSLEMYRHLKLRGKAPVRLVRYPGEQHGNRRAASRLDYCLRMIQWMEHYLKGPGGAPPPIDISYDEPRN
jgi:dipeptidyl aminopeptidase/acylaminoacyl peptidase